MQTDTHLERRKTVFARFSRRGVVHGDAAHLWARQLRVPPELCVQTRQQHDLRSQTASLPV